MHHELHKSTATLELLWSEYQEGVAARGGELKPYQYTQFCELYGAWRVRLKPSMRRVHLAGEKAFLDYSGKKPRIFDRETGEAREVELFVMVLGASNYTYAEATLTQGLRDFVGSTIHGFEYFGGVPESKPSKRLGSSCYVCQKLTDRALCAAAGRRRSETAPLAEHQRAVPSVAWPGDELHQPRRDASSLARA
jgi:hypothetical protein